VREPRVALVTARDALALDADLPPLKDALAALGAEVTMPVWDDRAVDWARFDIAVLRSTWDYAERVDEFLAWAKHCAELTRLANPLATVRWNTDKRYLVELARAGVPVVPTRFVAPGADAAAELEHFIGGDQHALTLGDTRGFADFVVKPVVGAGSRDVARYSRADSAAAREHLARLLGAGRHAMLQPYLARVDAHGETAVIFIAGVLSHSVRKGSLLKAGAGPVSGLVAPETITPQHIDQDELRVALAAVRAIPFEVPLYARVDLVRGDDDAPTVLELELTEPSIFFAHAAGSAHRLATAIIARIDN
jgi:glutathione synthase/RimK-type ligase-like ATP-grasp enzyme